MTSTVVQTALGEKGLSDRVRADLDADHSTRRAYTRGEQIEAAARTAPDLQDPGAIRYPDLIKQAGRFMTELLSLPVAEDVVIPTGHVCLLWPSCQRAQGAAGSYPLTTASTPPCS
jgi:hypothetical protein